ncbi:hypothetical protein CK203_031560 [Vitis vinifera]|uniref:Uncharacterized protein n=1 Tax=Vitis vinifera TaxID=29760 RepID=A0A438IGG1_VITVI|nr:hypothetical protein CK203_031560 [Vitis vinifera]
MGLAMTTNTLPPALLSASSISSSFRRPLYCHYSSISASPRILSSVAPVGWKRERISKVQFSVEKACHLLNSVEGKGFCIVSLLIKGRKIHALNPSSISLISDVLNINSQFGVLLPLSVLLPLPLPLHCLSCCYYGTITAAIRAALPPVAHIHHWCCCCFHISTTLLTDANTTSTYSDSLNSLAPAMNCTTTSFSSNSCTEPWNSIFS